MLCYRGYPVYIVVPLPKIYCPSVSYYIWYRLLGCREGDINLHKLGGWVRIWRIAGVTLLSPTFHRPLWLIGQGLSRVHPPQGVIPSMPCRYLISQEANLHFSRKKAGRWYTLCLRRKLHSFFFSAVLFYMYEVLLYDMYYAIYIRVIVFFVFPVIYRAFPKKNKKKTELCGRRGPCLQRVRWQPERLQWLRCTRWRR